MEPTQWTTDIQVLLTRSEWQRLEPELSQHLTDEDCTPMNIAVEELSFACEPDNMLVSEYQQREGHPPVAEILHRVVVHSRSTRAASEVTKHVVTALGNPQYWYGTTSAGFLDPGSKSACNISL
ncbi:hypothetical protein ACFPVT_07190 [Corynebacterium choanae]|nr:hypothetical protein [Corynebacterium choanae]